MPISMPILAPPPGRLSTITCCPNASPSFCPVRRATKSEPPPAAKGTMMRTGFVGYCWAIADAAIASVSAATTDFELRAFI
jgi:hypothetical protein